MSSGSGEQESVAGDVDADHDVLEIPVAGGVGKVLEADLQFEPTRLDAGQDLVGSVRIERGGRMKDCRGGERAADDVAPVRRRDR